MIMLMLTMMIHFTLLYSSGALVVAGCLLEFQRLYDCYHNFIEALCYNDTACFHLNLIPSHTARESNSKIIVVATTTAATNINVWRVDRSSRVVGARVF